MRKKVIRVGSSAAVTISPAELAAIGVRIGDQVDVRVQGDTLIVTPAAPPLPDDPDELLALVEARWGRR